MKSTFTLLAICAPFALLAQGPGSLDPSFDPGAGANAALITTLLQPDGKVLIGGQLTSFNGTTTNSIARLNEDGSLDAGFVTGAGANNTIEAMALRPDGKIIIVGFFNTYGGTPRNRIARLDPDGSLDLSFDPGTGANNAITATAIQPDGKILIGGSFQAYNGSGQERIARLNADGSTDPSFNNGSGADGAVRTIVLQPDGKILIGGEFSTYNGTPRNRIARLNANGTLDTSFDPGAGATGEAVLAIGGIVYTIALQSDGRIIIGGAFDAYNGTPRNRIARLNANGSLDGSFDPGTGAGPVIDPETGQESAVFTAVLQADGKIVIGGSFSTYDGTARGRIARLNTDGSLDTDFDPGTGANINVQSAILQPDGKIIIGGFFTTYDGTLINRIARLLVDAASGLQENAERAASVLVFPNPSDGAVTIVPEMANDDLITVDILDAMGRSIARLHGGMHRQGQRYEWPADVAPGHYYCRIASAHGVLVAPLVIH